MSAANGSAMRNKISVRIIIAGIEAIAAFTIKNTIDQNGIFMSVTVTEIVSSCVISSSESFHDRVDEWQNSAS